MICRSLIAILIFPLIFASAVQAAAIRYVALGDSYTTGTGVAPKQTWPSQLTAKLKVAGLDIALVANLGQNGWTATQVLSDQVPLLKKHKPDFITLLIGVNDWIRGGASSKKFTRHLQTLLDRIGETLPRTGKLLLVTIPDFSCSPEGKKWGYGKSAPNGITRLNRIVAAEAAARNLPLVDIFPLSQRLCSDASMFAGDELHPSAAQYALWVERIFPVVLDLLKDK